MADGPATTAIEPNDWQAVEPNDWQTVGKGAVLPKSPPSENIFSEGGKQLLATGKGLFSLLPGKTGEPLSGIAHGLYETAATPVRELLGQPQPGQSVLTAPADFKGRVAGALDAALGGDPAAARAHVQSGQQGAAIADLLTVPAATFGVGRLLKGVIPRAALSTEKRANLLTKAAGATEGKAMDFPREFTTALLELDKTPPKVPFDKMTVADLNGHVQDTFTRLEQDFNSRLAPIANQLAPAQSAEVASPVAAELRSRKIAQPVTPKDIAKNNALEARALQFDRPLTYGQLNEQRMLARDRIGDFHKKFPSTQGSQMGSNINILMDTVTERATRDMVYDALDRTYAGKVPPDYFRNLKRTESALYNIKDQLSGRTKELSNQSAKTFLDRMRMHEFASSSGHAGLYVGGITNALFPEGKMAQRALRKGMVGKHTNVPARAGGILPVVGRRGEPSLAPEEEPQE
jgi:hypothetical protein